ncbi:MAG: hypothetical protein SynsKO_07510 [Synoicihabitans sp.]
MRKFKIYLLITMIVLASIVIAQNTAVVETKVLFMTISMPRAGLLATTLAVGILIGIALTLLWRRKQDKVTPPDEKEI